MKLLRRRLHDQSSSSDVEKIKDLAAERSRSCSWPNSRPVWTLANASSDAEPFSAA
jgi:hypothetical protein